MRLLGSVILLVGLVFGADEAGGGVGLEPFRTALGPEFDRLCNRMWQVYGLAVDGAVARFGNEPAYFEWMALKIMWCPDEAYKDEFRRKLIEFPMSADGYMWSWGTQPRWPTGHGSLHFENNAKYILGCARYYLWTRDDSFLSAVDSTTVDERDASAGMSVLQKMRAAMAYQLDVLGGRRGVLRIDNGENDGTRTGDPSNYWDNFRFGYLEGYCSIYFYASLGAMADVEDLAGDRRAAVGLRRLARRSLMEYRRTFWDRHKGRFIGCVDRNGTRWDLGFTFLNTEATAYGLASTEQARRIYDWLDGKRIVEGDWSTGEDIYHFGWAPRSTTVAVEALGSPYWWFDLDGAITVGPGGNANFGNHVENGGAILYTSYYDIMGRLRCGMTGSALGRFLEILSEFAVDELRRDPVNAQGAPWVVGIVGEFPESGLVPTVLVHGFAGISARREGLCVCPRLPEAMPWVEVHDLTYAGARYTIRAARDGVAVSCRSEGQRDLPLEVGGLRPWKAYRVTIAMPGEDKIVRSVRADAAGRLHLSVKCRGGGVILVGQPL